MVTLFLTGNNFSLMVKFDEVRTGGNMMPTATLAVGTTEGKISGKRHLKVKGDGDDCWKKGRVKPRKMVNKCCI